MLELWTLLPSPTANDPERHTLLLRGELSDVQAVIRRFGAICGRPQKERGHSEYNFSLYLHRLDAAALQGVEAALHGMGPAGAPPGVGVPPLHGMDHPPLARPAAPVAALPETPAFPAVARAATPPPSPLDDAVPPEPRPLEPAPEARPAFVLATPELAAAPDPLLAAPGPFPAAAPAPERPLLGALVPLNAAHTFDTLQVGSFNRFSHAASMAVVSNPGTMYNPLFLFGAPGTGKTHLLMAIGRSLQEQAPNEPVLVTTGARLSKAAARAKREGRLEELAAFAQGSKALLIDDVHLLSVSEENQEGLVSLLATYFKATRQVVMTSVYPPRALGALEDALKFQISAGWSVDMKALPRETLREIVAPGILRAGFEGDAGVVDAVLGQVEGSFFDFGRWLERLKALAALRAGNRQPAAAGDLLPVLFSPDPTPGPAVPSEEIQGLLAQLPAPPPAPANAPGLAVFFPQGREAHAEYMLRQFHATAARNGWALPFRPAAVQPYDPEQLTGIPFSLGDACESLGARAALILGPNPGSGLAGRELELRHAIEHILESLEVRCGWVPFVRLKEPGFHFRAALDLQPAFQGGA